MMLVSSGSGWTMLSQPLDINAELAAELDAALVIEFVAAKRSNGKNAKEQ